MHALTERSSLPENWHQRSMQWHCIMVCKLALCNIYVLYFWQLVGFLESVDCSYILSSNLIQEVMQSFDEASSCSSVLAWLWTYYLFVSHTALPACTICTCTYCIEMPICSHSSVNTHIDCRGYGVEITQLCLNYGCLH